MSMGCSSVCEKNKDESGGGKLKESLLTLLIKTPLLIGSIGSKFSGENSFNEVGKTGLKSTKNLIKKQCPNPQIYRLRKTSRWGLTDLTVGRPANGHISDRCAIGRPAGRPRPGYREQVSLSGRPPGAFPESRALWTVESSKLIYTCAYSGYK